ncbi:MAG TPA: DUF1992 domain-containing protein [Myxococcota bacterium]|jgi:hypothetical protein|nr:DUF1992 domain-containing protein [Myxococcota bacterium]
MTKRKPPGTTVETWIEAQLREARERGEFDDLPGQGKPLADLEEANDPYWWAKKLLRREGVSALPPALAIRRRVELALERLGELASERAVRELVAALNAEIRRVNSRTAGAAPTTLAPLDEAAVLARWRDLRESPRSGS